MINGTLKLRDLCKREPAEGSLPPDPPAAGLNTQDGAPHPACLCSPPAGGLVGERAPAPALPPLVPLRLLPEASGRLAAPQGGDSGGAALRHRGTG